MEVRCERCKTEYEFDDERVTEAEVIYVGVDPETRRPTPLLPEK